MNKKIKEGDRVRILSKGGIEGIVTEVTEFDKTTHCLVKVDVTGEYGYFYAENIRTPQLEIIDHIIKFKNGDKVRIVDGGTNYNGLVGVITFYNGAIQIKINDWLTIDVVNDYLVLNKIELVDDVAPLISNKILLETRRFAFYQHDIEVNQWYDKKNKIPYSYHLQMVADIGIKYIHLLPTELHTRALQGCYLHDIVEDARLTFNDLVSKFGVDVASDSCALCTNISGHTRDERANKWYYDKINEHKVRVFIKLCDRIANVEQSVMYSPNRLKTHSIEMYSFIDKLDTVGFEDMVKHLNSLL